MILLMAPLPTNSNLSSKPAFLPLTLHPHFIKKSFKAITVHLLLIVTVAQSSNPLPVVDIALSGWHVIYYEIDLLFQQIASYKIQILIASSTQISFVTYTTNSPC